MRGAIGRAPPPCSARRRTATSLAAQSEEGGRTRRAAIERGGAQSVAALRGSCGEPASWRKTRRAPSSRITALSCNRQRTNCRSLKPQDRDRQSERRPSRPALNLSVARTLHGITREGHHNPVAQTRRRVAMADALRTDEWFRSAGWKRRSGQGRANPDRRIPDWVFTPLADRPAAHRLPPALEPSPQARGNCASRHPPMVCRPEYKSA